MPDYLFDKPFAFALWFRFRTKIDEIQQRKEDELKSINLRVQKLQSDLMNANQVRAANHLNINNYALINAIIIIIIVIR